MKHDAFFRNHPVFDGNELVVQLSSLGEVRGRTQESFLAYHRKAGRVVRVQGGLYAISPREPLPVHILSTHFSLPRS